MSVGVDIYNQIVSHAAEATVYTLHLYNVSIQICKFSCEHFVMSVLMLLVQTDPKDILPEKPDPPIAFQTITIKK